MAFWMANQSPVCSTESLITYRGGHFFWHIASCYKHGACSAIREGDFKLIQYFANEKVELYNLKDDPAESKNLAAKSPEVTQRLLKKLTGWRKENNAQMPPNSPLPY